MNTEEIRQLIKIINENDEIGEIEITRTLLGTSKIKVARSRGRDLVGGAPAAVPAAVAAPTASGGVEPEISGDSTIIKAQMVGTFYRAMNPETPPFVNEGDRIVPGKVMCIIEAMKLMNEIEADCTGVVKEILVENGQTVEFGQPLFAITKG